MRMSQTRLSSLAETVISIAIGFVVSLVITAIVLPAYGHHVTLSENVQITAIFTVASIVRMYCVRRFFNWIANRYA
jgi:hypothetical protein